MVPKNTRRGKTGERGASGASGQRGLSGQRGAEGASGQRGQTGGVGETGGQGEIGATGGIGLTGGQGEIGATGRIGATGAAGRDGKRQLFDWNINLGHVFIVFSLFLSAAGLYAHDEARLSELQTKVTYLETANLPPRVSSLETQAQGMHDALVDLRNDIRTGTSRLVDLLNQKFDKK